MKYAEIVGIDTLWYDQILNLPSIPDVNGSMFVDSSSYQGGGKVCSALAAAGRQGIACRLIAARGDDARSDFLAEDLENHGVSCDSLVTIPGYEVGWSVVLSDAQSGARRILWHRNDKQASLTLSDIDRFRDDIIHAKYLHLCRMDNVDRAAAAIARDAGVTTCLDADFYDDTIVNALSDINILIGSEEFYDKMFPEGGDYFTNCASISQMGPSTVIFTFGKMGCRGLVDGKPFECPAFSVDVVDTVGAGDVFHGGYLAALCHGIPGGYEAARYASAVSAVKCTSIGGRSGIPTKEQVEAFMENGTIPKKEIEDRVAYYSTMH